MDSQKIAISRSETTMTTPTTAVVEKIKELLTKATPGPWEPCERGAENPVFTVASRHPFDNLCMFYWPCHDPTPEAMAKAEDETYSDIELVCLLRNSIQGLLEERKRHIEALKEIDWILSVAKGREPSSEAKVRIEGVAKEALSPAGENGGMV